LRKKPGQRDLLVLAMHHDLKPCLHVSSQLSVLIEARQDMVEKSNLHLAVVARPEGRDQALRLVVEVNACEA
jgi:hypothetical protein